MNAIAQASAAPSTGPKLDNRRVLAALVDLALVAVGAVVILFAADALSGDRSEVRGALSAVILGWTLYYYFALETGGGQTVGKKLLKLRVVRADGRPAGMREIAVRTVLRVVDGVGAYIVGLIVMLVTGQRRQRLGDLAAGTIVVDASAPAFVPAPAPVEAAPAQDAPAEEPLEELQRTISLPSRPAAPATLADLAEPEAPAVPEPVVEDELEEPAHDVAAVQAEVAPVEEEPIGEEQAEVAPVEEEPVDEEPVDDAPVGEESVEDEPFVEEPVEDETPAEGAFTVKPMQTVSAIDLVMGGAPEEDDSADEEHYPGDAAS
jgi:uncharacterized RDD family membrane protein YckC